MITKWLTRFDASGLVLLLPLYALVMIILHIILAIDFRNALSARIAGAHPSGIPDEHSDPVKEPVKGFRSALLFADHYLDLISGRLDYLKNHADESYASEVTATAGKAFDPALLPALRVMVPGNQFSEQVRQDAALLISNIEKYYSDPVRNSDLLRLPGISEKAAAARSIMLNKREPSMQEIVKLLGDRKA